MARLALWRRPRVTARYCKSGGRSGAGLGDTLDAAPRSAWSGRIVIAKPADPTRQRSSNCQPRMSAPALSRFHRLQVSPAPPAGIGEVFVDRPRGPAHRGPSAAALGLERNLGMRDLRNA